MTERGDDSGAPAPLAWLLAPVAGFVDAVGFIMLAGIFVANMSGNVVRLGVDIGDAAWSDAATRGVPILTFVVGVGLAIGIVRAVGNRAAGPPMTIFLAMEIGLLVAVALLGSLVWDGRFASGTSLQFYVLITLAVLAMATQTVTLRQVAGIPVQTTYITTMIAFVGEETVQAITERGTPRAREAWRRVRVHGGIWLTYLVGGGVGAYIAYKLEYAALVVPVAMLVVVLIASRYRPRLHTPRR
jgi:uncharacterized membrane protein YoaK (UPF0700 family)